MLVFALLGQGHSHVNHRRERIAIEFQGPLVGRQRQLRVAPLKMRQAEVHVGRDTVRVDLQRTLTPGNGLVHFAAESQDMS